MVRLEGEVAHRIGRVLRISPGDKVILLDNSGAEYVASLSTFASDLITEEAVSAQEPDR